MARRRTTTAVLLLALSAAAGCGADREGPSDDQQVRAVVARFGIASRARDYQTICDDLLAADLVRSVQSVGLPCESALQRGLAGVRDPRLEIREVSISGARALVAVHTTAAGEPPSDDAIQLVRENDQWRIAALAAPAASSAAPSSAAPPASTPTPSSGRTPSTGTTTPTTPSPTTTTRGARTTTSGGSR